jgi:hypothetical protein
MHNLTFVCFSPYKLIASRNFSAYVIAAPRGEADKSPKTLTNGYCLAKMAALVWFEFPASRTRAFQGGLGFSRRLTAL